MRSGVYRIDNSINGKCYVGSSIDLNRRRKEHSYTLANNSHANRHLQYSYNKYGREFFRFTIIEILDISENIKQLLLEREQFWIDNLLPEYNILLIAGTTLGFNHSVETKEQISNSTKGVKKSAEHSKHIKEAQKGKILTEEHKKKLSESAKNRKSASHSSKVSIDGVIYDSLKEASEILNIKYNTISKRLANPNFQNYFYMNGKITKIIKSPKKGMNFKNTPVIIDDELYEFALNASKILSIKINTVKYRIASSNFPNYSFLEPQLVTNE